MIALPCVYVCMYVCMIYPLRNICRLARARDRGKSKKIKESKKKK